MATTHSTAPRARKVRLHLAESTVNTIVLALFCRVATANDKLRESIADDDSPGVWLEHRESGIAALRELGKGQLADAASAFVGVW